MWRPVVGYEGLYEVSDLGRVRSVDRVVMRGGRVHQLRGIVLTIDQSRADGRRQVSLSREGRHTNALVAHLVLTAFVGARPAGLVACHNNGDEADDRAENLRWDTQRNNLLDRNTHGTNPQRNRTHCPRDHPLQAPNLCAAAVRAGHRACYACELARGRMKSARRKGLVLDLTFRELADQCFAEVMATAEEAS
jgi:hypothetical protein